jgi:hypothetical protein
MKYFDRSFWRMTAGFLLFVAVGLAAMYLVNQLDQNPRGNGMLKALSSSPR